MTALVLTVSRKPVMKRAGANDVCKTLYEKINEFFVADNVGAQCYQWLCSWHILAVVLQAPGSVDQSCMGHTYHLEFALMSEFSFERTTDEKQKYELRCCPLQLC